MLRCLCQIRVALYLAIIGHCIAPTQLSAASPDPVGATVGALYKDLARLRARHNIPVLGLSLLHDTRVTHKVWGANEDVLLRWGSITKTVTALTILALVERGQLQLHDRLQDHIDDKHWRNRWQADAPVLVHHLLELTAGFPDLSGVEFNFTEPLSLGEALALNPAHRHTRWPPGLQHVYSNMTPGLTQVLIEQTSNKRFATAATELVLAPLGMHTAGFSPSAALPGGFRADGKTPIPYWHMTFPAYGALNASVPDLARMLAYLSSTQFSGDAQHKISSTGKTALFQANTSAGSRHGLSFGYAAGLYNRVRQGFVWHTHGGDADGYRSRMAFLSAYPQGAARGYVININTDNPRALRAMERLVEKHLLQDLQATSPPPPFPVSPAQLQQLAGSYYPTGSRFLSEAWQAGTQAQLQLSVAQPTAARQSPALHYRAGERSGILLPVSTKLYRRPDDPQATVVIIREGQSTYMQGELGNFVRLPNCPEHMRHIAACRI